MPEHNEQIYAVPVDKVDVVKESIEMRMPGTNVHWSGQYLRLIDPPHQVRQWLRQLKCPVVDD